MDGKNFKSLMWKYINWEQFFYNDYLDLNNCFINQEFKIK